ncbi:nitrate reductase molybdenum cofactor assembly chaperone [Denitratisoma sp. DHT3]|uniref:nitrate reductase molybdenum cofactor assembly chaperone n=1 Tax=Denitratisoma sp. DHT3 TaxID=1981880 RepID=UPI0011986E7F|nr:nitrate reductase molybdenum cofactor assembly chaperone [Denitratisoma sp. DHT3]QDX82889.1 nitrate reductase molybdenum cofactor assembly chaperone [Denitratisoma sp. DHT3]
MQIFKLIALLLNYPSDEDLAALTEAVRDEGAGSTRTLVARLDDEGRLGDEEVAAVAHFIDHLLATDPTQLRADYVQTFDMTPEHSLHLTHHIFGEEKTRGPALIDLGEIYRSYGLAHDPKELPDFLPLILEFVSGLEAEEGRVFLADMGKVLGVLATHLEQAGSPYASLIRIVEAHGSLARLAA